MKARSYQLDLMDYVVEQNGVIYLPTGAGKTYIAILALKRLSKDFNKTIDNGGKRGVFMCKTVELVYQQAAQLRNHTSFTIGVYLGCRGVDNWTSEKWKEEIDKNQVLVGTAQIFLNMVSQNILKITDLSIVIIDECHHGIKKDAMHEFMRTFKLVSDEKYLPRVIGLTGVLLKGNKHNSIMESLRNLEITYRAKIVTVNSEEEFLNVLIHSTHPREIWLQYEHNFKSCNINDAIETQIKYCKNVVEEFNIGNYPIKMSKGLAQERGPSPKRAIIKLLNEFNYHLYEYGLYCSMLVLQYAIVEMQIKQNQAETISLRRMYRVVISILESIHHMIRRKFTDFLNEINSTNDDCHQMKIILEFCTPKVLCLLNYIENNFVEKNQKDISCLIFVKRRLTAKIVSNIIEKFVQQTPTLKDIIIPAFMVGTDSMYFSTVENILERKWNKKVMSDFHCGICNVIVCTNVLEEGIDVQACNCVIVFDPIETFDAYIQSKGRARSNDSTYVLVASKDKKNAYVKQTENYVKIHESVKKFLLERIIDHVDPNQNEIDEEFSDIIPPLKLENGACILASSAISKLNQYCQNLPCDIFGCLLPEFKKISNDEFGVVVSVKLPLQSRVKEEIMSDPMKNVNMAKMSAAIKTCKRLYEEGELNNNLLPTSRDDCIKSISDILFKHWDKYEDNAISKKEGKAKQRLYEKRCPEELYDAMPIVGEVCYAHKILIEPEFEPNDYNSHVIEALQTKSKYALLLRRRLPKCAPMPFFMQQGILKVYILESIELIIDNEDHLEQLRKYHLMTIRDILQCWRSFYVLDSRNKQNSFLIVPLFEDKIDWIMVKKFAQLKPVVKPSLHERQNLNYKPEDWLGKIVTKWYTCDSNKRFLVTKVHTEHTPLDKFPDEKFEHETYLEYFESRYGNVIDRVLNRKQFLIEVKPLTERRNFFNNAKSKGDVHKINKERIILLPELCHNFEFPGDLWLQALFLPSILHRLHYLLHSEHLRNRINSFLNVPNTIDYKPKPLIIDISLRRAVDVDGNICIPYEKTPVLLPPLLPNAKEGIYSETTDLTSNQGLWNAHEEPITLARQSFNIYPVELQYFCNFERKWTLQHNLKEVGYANDHLQMRANSKTVNALGPCSSTRLALEDQLIEERRRIHILERSFQEKNSQKLLVTAEQHEFLAALTTSNANDVFDMERFELLGDSFLKFSISLYLANKFPNWHEGFLTDVKSKLVSNRNLLYCMLETDIPTRICSNIFKIDEWLPPLVSLPQNILEALEKDSNLRTKICARNICDIELDESEVLSGRCNDKRFKKFMDTIQMNEIDDKVASYENTDEKVHNDINYFTYKEVRADKIIADTLEALLGVCVNNFGINMSFRLLEFFGLCRPEIGDKPLTDLLDLNLGGPLLRTELSSREIDQFLINYECLETNLGYTFRDRAYLLQALTHPSFPTNRITGCYQELEFIGDAILDLLITCYIFERNKTMTPGMLTDLRSALVNNITLGCICVRHRFHLFLLAQNATLAELICEFAEYQETQNNRVSDQVHILMEETDATSSNSKMNISQNVEVPKVLGDIVEALIAAVYLDSRCLQTTWNVIYGLLEQELNEFSHKIPIDPVRQLHEYPSAYPKFDDPITDKGTQAVKCTFYCHDQWIKVYGFGKNKWEAKKAAAKWALRKLKNY